MLVSAARHLVVCGWAITSIGGSLANSSPVSALRLGWRLSNGALGVGLLVAALRLVRHRDVAIKALWAMLALVGAYLLIVTGFRVYWNLRSTEQGWGWLVVGAWAFSLGLVIATLAWYSWPVLRGRETVTLDDPPRCQACGYNLTGNTNGRGPECGAAVPVTEIQQGVTN